MKLSKIKISDIFKVLIVLIIITSFILIMHLQATRRSIQKLNDDIDVYMQYYEAFDSMKEASTYLTDSARYFVTTGQIKYLEDYLDETRNVRRRDKALEVIGKGDPDLYDKLNESLRYSNELVKTEIYAMELAAEGYGIDVSSYGLAEYEAVITKEDEALSNEDKKDKAIALLFDDYYHSMKESIRSNAYDGIDNMLDQLREREEKNAKETSGLMLREYVFTGLLIVLAIAGFLITMALVVNPLNRGIELIKNNERLPERGVYEVAYLAKEYNLLHAERTSSINKLSYEASHDPLTGLFNRGAFDENRDLLKQEKTAVIIIDVDHFKEVNDTYGHETGDVVLKDVASKIERAFRSTDIACRIGGDEFAVILKNISKDNLEILLKKIEMMRESLRESTDHPEVTLSIGIAFNEGTDEDIFAQADEALYEAKDRGRNTTVVYGN